MNALHRIERYLDAHHIPFDLVAHPHSQTSLDTAHKAGISASAIAKGVLLDGDRCQMVAMIPADRDIHLGKLGQDHGIDFRLAAPRSMDALFKGCDSGVVPGLPTAWGVEMVWDDALMDNDWLYLEAGDHERLVKIETRYLRELFGDAPHCRFCETRH
jgi:Ala-tRNA(Pro) deacylase